MSTPGKENLAHYYTDELIIKKTIIQIRKDLGLDDSELAFDVSADSFYNSLVSQVSVVIDYFLSKSFEQLMQCLYKVDINQQKLEECLTNGQYDSKCVAEMVVKRCLQKVVIREWYKKNQ